MGRLRDGGGRVALVLEFAIRHTNATKPKGPM